MKTINLTKDKMAIVDDSDYDELIKYRWYAFLTDGLWYAARGDGKQITLMHRQIMNAEKGMFIDHINGNGLDNRQENLRFTTLSQNQFNRGKPKNNTSGFKGVIHARGTRWTARIIANHKYFHLGTFENKEDAARAYDEAARLYHGEFAKTNF